MCRFPNVPSYIRPSRRNVEYKCSIQTVSDDVLSRVHGCSSCAEKPNAVANMTAAASAEEVLRQIGPSPIFVLSAPDMLTRACLALAVCDGDTSTHNSCYPLLTP